MSFRRTAPFSDRLIGSLLVALSAFHYYTSGFGILVESWHLGIHLSFVLGLIFLVFGASRREQEHRAQASLWRPGGIPLYDWLLASLAVVAALYVPIEFHQLAFRIGDPLTRDVVVGSVMLLLILEATRRAMGWALPLIVLVFVLYALFGRYAPGPLAHPGADWRGLINHLYLTTQGIYGIPVHVVATFVFHFVLFGVIAVKIGLGQLFIDLAYCAAGRYAGGPAKVSVLSSAMFGMISGSSIANTVTTGALTIPAMKRVGYKPHFAAAVEATASTGGQITPPLMGAAAFVMAEFLEIPYRDIIIAAIVPAALHFLGVLVMVHLEAKRLGLRGLTTEELPQAWRVLRDGWPTLIPLVILVGTLLTGRTPYAAAFYGITACIVVGFLNPRCRLTLGELWDAFKTGAKYALAVGAAAAAVGVIVGVVTLSGMGFRVSFIVVNFASELGTTVAGIFPFGLVSAQGAALFLTLLLTGVACIVLGAGIPTTACYIILAAIAAPALAQLGVSPLVSHFFVFYYGVLADVTPPVAVAAYAGAGIAGANPFRTGNTAFRLANAKALVPFVFVYAPSLLLIADGFSLYDFVVALAGCILGIVFLGAALTGYLLTAMKAWQRLPLAVGAFLMIAPDLQSSLLGLVFALPVVVGQALTRRRAARAEALEAAE